MTTNRMKRNLRSDEIDLIDTLIIIWQNKFKILIISIFISISANLYFSLESNKTIALTEIIPISTFEESEYDTYNSFLSMRNLALVKMETDEFGYVKGDIKDERTAKFENFNKINRTYLYNLFINKLKENSSIVKKLDQFNFIDKEKFSNTEEYNDAVLDMSKSINIFPLINSIEKGGAKLWQIKHETTDIERWEIFLKFLENLYYMCSAIARNAGLSREW